MRIGITGGCGFVGSNLARYFQYGGAKVIAFDNLSRRGSEVNLSDLQRHGVEFIHGDIRVQDDVELLAKCDVILECAAQPSAIGGYERSRLDFESNTMGVMNVLELCRQTQAGLIFWSTNKVYSGNRINNLVDGSPNKTPFGKDGIAIKELFPLDGGDKSIYGATKAAADLLCQEWSGAFDFPCIVNRFSCLAGPYQYGVCAQGWVAWFAIAAKLGLPISLIGWNGEQVRDVLFSDDLCKLIERQIFALSKHRGSVFNVGGGPENTLSLRQAIEIIEIDWCEYPHKIQYAVEEQPRRSDHRVYISDIRKVVDEFDWKPRIGPREGYRQIFNWIDKEEETLRRMYKP